MILLTMTFSVDASNLIYSSTASLVEVPPLYTTSLANAKGCKLSTIIFCDKKVLLFGSLTIKSDA